MKADTDVSIQKCGFSEKMRIKKYILNDQFTLYRTIFTPTALRH